MLSYLIVLVIMTTELINNEDDVQMCIYDNFRLFPPHLTNGQ